MKMILITLANSLAWSKTTVKRCALLNVKPVLILVRTIVFLAKSLTPIPSTIISVSRSNAILATLAILTPKEKSFVQNVIIIVKSAQVQPIKTVPNVLRV